MYVYLYLSIIYLSIIYLFIYLSIIYLFYLSISIIYREKETERQTETKERQKVIRFLDTVESQKISTQ
jgi:threonine/homoserine/homoserine lactone efflux protein